MPVGEGVMGRVFDVTGNPVDERGPVKSDKTIRSIGPRRRRGAIDLASSPADRNQGD